MLHDEGPSQEDIDRFSTHETGFCPRCGEEIWDDTSKCPSCGVWLHEGTSHRDPITNDFRKRTFFIITLVLLFAFIYSLIRFF